MRFLLVMILMLISAKGVAKEIDIDEAKGVLNECNRMLETFAKVENIEGMKSIINDKRCAQAKGVVSRYKKRERAERRQESERREKKLRLRAFEAYREIPLKDRILKTKTTRDWEADCRSQLRFTFCKTIGQAVYKDSLAVFKKDPQALSETLAECNKLAKNPKIKKEFEVFRIFFGTNECDAAFDASEE